jgi:hypothetical protein
MRKAPAEASKVADPLIRSYSVNQIALCCEIPVLHNLSEVREHGTVFLYWASNQASDLWQFDQDMPVTTEDKGNTAA